MDPESRNSFMLMKLRMRKAFSSLTEELIRIDVVKIIHQIPAESRAHHKTLAREIQRTMWNKSITDIPHIGATISEYATSRSDEMFY